MHGIGCTKPQLMLLASGVLLLTGGRPGVFLWETDALARAPWIRHNLAA
eukprot:COSAG04_NODE_27427_length_283_cov_0.836957_1_plen_48_part_10